MILRSVGPSRGKYTLCQSRMSNTDKIESIIWILSTSEIQLSKIDIILNTTVRLQAATKITLEITNANLRYNTYTVGFKIHIEMIGGFASSRLQICQKCYEMSHYGRH